MGYFPFPIPDEAIKAAFDRYMATPDDDNDGITWATVELMLRDAIPYLRMTPIGDNHHNAVTCPYCNPRGLSFGP